MDQQYALELDYRVFTSCAHLIFGCINMGLSVGGMYYGGGLVRQGKLEMTDLMLFMQYRYDTHSHTHTHTHAVEVRAADGETVCNISYRCINRRQGKI